MKIGIVGNSTEYRIAAKLGYDYFEVIAQAVAKWTDEEFAGFLGEVKALGLPCEAACQMFPASLRLVGPEVDYQAIMLYLQKLFPRLQKLGVRTLVLGSGVARKIPENLSREKAKDQFIDLLPHVGNLAGEYALTIVLEPLNQKECNFINSLSEGFEIVQAVNHPQIKLLADSYHMAQDQDPVEDLVLVKEELCHTHTAGTLTRGYPGTVGQEELKDFFKILCEIGYEGRLSIEAKAEAFEKDAKVGLEYLRHVVRSSASSVAHLMPQVTTSVH